MAKSHGTIISEALFQASGNLWHSAKLLEEIGYHKEAAEVRHLAANVPTDLAERLRTYDKEVLTVPGKF